MALTLPYLPSNKNVVKLFEKIHQAQKPDTFTHGYLRDTIGLKGTNDRPLIPLLRSLGFLDASNRPTASYDLLKNPAKAKGAAAAGMRLAYGSLFKANTQAHTLSGEPLKGLIAQVTGADSDMVNRVAATFTTLAKQADFSGSGEPPIEISEEKEERKKQEEHRSERGLRPEFHYNIQIHLPGNGTEETYLNIFNALRRTFE